jgi:hypothetical protein
MSDLNRIMALVQTLGVAAHHAPADRLWSDPNVAAAKDNLFNELSALLPSARNPERAACGAGETSLLERQLTNIEGAHDLPKWEDHAAVDVLPRFKRDLVWLIAMVRKGVPTPAGCASGDPK